MGQEMASLMGLPLVEHLVHQKDHSTEEWWVRKSVGQKAMLTVQMMAVQRDTQRVGQRVETKEYSRVSWLESLMAH